MALDQLIINLVDSLEVQDLQQNLHYQSIAGEPLSKDFCSLMLHLFNHQTHHRGQVSTLLMQAGIDIGVTDLGMFIPVEA